MVGVVAADSLAVGWPGCPFFCPSDGGATITAESHIMPSTRFAILLALVAVAPVAAQRVTIPLIPSAWTATDSIRFQDFEGQRALWIDRGIALANGIRMRNGTIECDLWAGQTGGNVGLVFHVRDRNASEVIFVRPPLSGTAEAVQYAPALNSLGAAWQIYHGDGANAVATIARDRWVHLAVAIHGDSATFFVDGAKEPTLVVPHLMLGADAGESIGLWASAFRQPAYFANFSYTPDTTEHPAVKFTLPAGTIADWEISQPFDAATQLPGKLPAAAAFRWQQVKAEYPGIVLISRYRAAPGVSAPVDHPDAVLGGRVPGSKVVYARTVIDAPTAGMRLMRFGFSDGVVVYCNGVPLYSAIRPSGFFNDGRDLGYFERVGDAVYLPLKAGRNEIVMAVTEFFGGWAVSGVLDGQ